MGLDSEHFWPSAGGLSGGHRRGSALAYFGTQSQVSSADTGGRLMVTSDTSNLFAVGSNGTVFLGGQRSISAFTAPSTLPQRHQWVESFGTSITAAAGNVRVVYPDSGYSGIPNLQVTPTSNGTSAVIVFVSQSRSTDFTAIALVDGSGLSASLLTYGIALFDWRSLGTKAL